MDSQNRSAPPRIAVLINGSEGGIEWIRAGLHFKLTGQPTALLLARDASSIRTCCRWLRKIREHRSDLLYVINTANPGVPLACWLRTWARTPFFLDTGDVVFEMARSSGLEPLWRLPLLWGGENIAWRMAHTVVVRSRCFQEYLRGIGIPRVEVIHDGYHPGPNPPEEVVLALRRSLGLQGKFVIGVLGSLVYSPTLGICYGWDLIRAMPKLRDIPAHALIIGDGTGRPWLEKLATQLRVRDRVTFLGRVPYDTVPAHLRLFDIALSTQTNNLPGQVRTTGKLPEYMAAGRFILASRVGEAARLLPESMLLDYSGEVDGAYPERLASRIRSLFHQGDTSKQGAELVRLAEGTCNPDRLSGDLWRIIAQARVESRSPASGRF